MAITRLGGANAITGTIPTSVAPGQGKILQKVRTSASVTSNISTSSSSYVASGIQASLTPTTSGNLIFVDFISSMSSHASSSNLRAKFYRKIGSGSMVAAGGGSYELGYNTTTNDYSSLGGAVSYTTTSTDTITYEVFFRAGSAATAALVHSQGSYSLTLTEVEQ